MKDKHAKRVVIVGGGFGGLEAAKALEDTPVEVLVIDRVNYHLFQPLLYQVAMAGLSPADIASPIRGILADQKNVRVEMGEVTHVDLESKRVFLVDEVVDYDWLILAVGAKTGYFGNDDWEKYAPGMKHIEDALEIRRRVLLAFETAEREPDAKERQKLLTFVVIGGGPTGLELTGSIAELSRFVLGSDFRSIDPREAKVILVEAGPRILPSFDESLARSAVEQLQELGAEVRTGTRVVTLDGEGVEVEDGSSKGNHRIESSTIVWAAGVKANALAQTLGVPTDKQGRVIVGTDCAVPGHPEVFAIGDMARFEENGNVLPGVSPVAMQQARYVAKLIKWELESVGSPPRTAFKYFDKGSMATIGRSRAIAEARGIKMHGFIAWLAWLLIHIFYLIGFRNRVSVLWNWTWSYISYKRGARLITSTGWQPDLKPVSAALPTERVATPPVATRALAPREAARAPVPPVPTPQVATRTS